MNFPLPSQQTLFLLMILVNLAFILILAAIYLLVAKIAHDNKSGVREEHHLHRKIAEKIESEAGERLDRMIKVSTEHLESQIREQLEKLAVRAEEESRQMTEFVAKQEEAVMKESQLMVANIVAKAEKEAEVYKNNQIDKVSSQINSIVSAAAKDVLGRSISIAEHEDLVSQALERAKKDKFFA